MKKLLATLSLSAIIFTVACNDTEEGKDSSNTSDSTSSTTSSKPTDNALALLQSNCFNCHNPDKEAAVRVAPTMADIKTAYKADELTGSEFAHKMIAFINNPTEENSHMPEAVKQYGMMPKLNYKEEQLEAMAAYIYKNDIGSDEWYIQWKATKDQPAGTNTADMSYEDLGLSIANRTKAQLGKNLMGALKKHGAPGAVTFCNTRAIPLTDSMAKVLHAGVKRVSDQPRNPNNQANEAEIAYIKELKEKIAKGEPLTPKIIEAEDKVTGYYAIETNKMCIQCHGNKNTDILPETYANIHKAYPADKATGYGEKQIRGIWVITMDKK